VYWDKAYPVNKKVKKKKQKEGIPASSAVDLYLIAAISAGRAKATEEATQRINLTSLTSGAITLLGLEAKPHEKKAIASLKRKLKMSLEELAYEATTSSFPGFMPEKLPQQLWHYVGKTAFCNLKISPDNTARGQGMKYR